MNRVARLLITCVIAVTATSLTACGGDQSEPAQPIAQAATADVKFDDTLENGLPTSYGDPEPADVTIGLLNPLGANESVKATADAATKEVERLGGKVIELDGKGDPNTQVNQAEQLVAQGVDGIAVPFPLDARALAPVLERAIKADVPVIGIDVSVTSTDLPAGFTSQVWARRDETAYLQAQATAAALGDGAQVAQIGFAVPVPTLEYGVERAKHWAEAFGLTVVGRVNNPSDDIAGGEMAMTQLLAKYPEVGGVIGYNEQSVIGGASAARTQGVPNLKLVGANGGTLGLNAVADDQITATVQPPYVSAASEMVAGLYEAIGGAGDIPPIVLAPDPPELVTADNVDSVPSFAEQIESEYGG